MNIFKRILFLEFLNFIWYFFFEIFWNFQIEFLKFQNSHQRQFQLNIKQFSYKTFRLQSKTIAFKYKSSSCTHIRVRWKKFKSAKNRFFSVPIHSTLICHCHKSYLIDYIVLNIEFTFVIYIFTEWWFTISFRLSAKNFYVT